MPSRPPSLRQRPRAKLYIKSADGEYRAKTKPWYGTAQWKRRRQAQLDAEPLCWMCERDGRVTRATVADHDPPHRGDWDAFATGPLRSLCKRHHDGEKARIENGRGTNRPR